VCGLPITAGASSAAPAGSSVAPAGGPSAPPPLAPPTGTGGAVPQPPAATNPLSIDTIAGTGPSAPAAVRTCPNCATDNPADALFCENCGYDFTTGQLPRPLPPPDAGDVQPVPPPVPAAGADTGSPDADVSWVAEVWVDPDWYAAQGIADPLPSVGAPVIVPLAERSVLIGRTSASRNIHPQIDCSADSGVSRRHAQLSTDGQRWWIEDLQSSNGTFIGGAGEPVPTAPISPGQRVELEDDDRVYIGGWTRIVVRQA
jgi:hypothetical protein